MLLTTHYMLEADELCDRVAIIDRGRILACDTPANLKRSCTGTPPSTSRPPPSPAGLDGQPMVGLEGFSSESVSEGPDPFRPRGRVGHRRHHLLISSKGGKVIALGKSEPTLEDVFIDLVGRGLE